MWGIDVHCGQIRRSAPTASIIVAFAASMLHAFARQIWVMIWRGRGRWAVRAVDDRQWAMCPYRLSSIIHRQSVLHLMGARYTRVAIDECGSIMLRRSAMSTEANRDT